MKKISLYIHIPFCAQKCFYCDFASYAGKENLQKRYIQCLCKELDNVHKSLGTYLVETIFIGGGTPSILPVELLKILLAKIKELNIDENVEYSMECNPGSLTKEKLHVMKMLGVNRISMGLQAVQDDLLKVLGRVHNFKLFRDNYLLAREYGFNNINVDLMFGLPNQKIDDWKRTLEEIIKLQPEHISSYSLIIEEGTKFYRLYNDDKLKLPTEDIERDMYNISMEILKQSGYFQYEISNYAKRGRECKHNLAYWNMKEWIGVGSAASSFIDNKRIKNVDSISDYINKIESNEKPYEEVITNSENDTMEEFMFMGLRKINGICEEEFRERFACDIDKIYKDTINKYVNEELLIREKGRIYLSKKGIELSNQVMVDFLLD